MDFWNTVSFHTEAMARSWGESVSDLATGTLDLLTETAPKQASKSYYVIKEAVDEYLPGLGSIAGGIAAPLSYLLNITLIPAGESIGGGLGMAIYGRNAEDVAMGITSVFSGIGATSAMFAGIFAPRPVVNIYSLQIYISGELAIAPVASMELVGSISAAGVVCAAITNGGLINMSGKQDEVRKEWDEIFAKYGAELLRDARHKQGFAINARASLTDKNLLKSLAKESGLNLTTIIKLALRCLRDAVKQ